jgi:hypothetical protein
MSAHLKDETLAELLAGEGSTERRAHAASCRPCGARLAEAQEVLSALQRTDVPEPPPLYWEAFRRNVSRRIAEERLSPAWRRWLVPLAALSATAVIAVVAPRTILRAPDARLTGTPSTAVADVLPAWTALPPAEEDEGMSVLEGLASSGSDLAELFEGRGLGSYIAGLTEEETLAALSGGLPEAGEGGVL